MSENAQQTADGTPRRVLIAGGGVGALEAAVALRAQAGDRVHLRIVAPQSAFTWRALEAVEPFAEERPRQYPIDDLAQELRADVVHDEIVHVDMAASRARSRSHGEIDYDSLIVAIGARPRPVVEAAETFDRLSFPEVFDEVLDALRSRLAESLLVVVPHGVVWSLPAYELAMLSAAGTSATVTLATHEPRPLTLFGASASRAVEQALATAGVEIRCGVQTDVVSATAARIDGLWVTADRIVALPGFVGPGLSGIPANPEGFIVTDAEHRVPDADGRVFAIGDGAAGPLKHGGMAARAADRVATRIALEAGAPIREDAGPPVLRGLLRTSEGPLFLAADLRDPEGTGTASTSALWWPPTKVAAPWLSSFLTDLEGRRLVAGG